ncbi:hypothetical protein [Desulforhopalus singaporensis]|nr:hypothetical protein [Desulforhopalus singaporensis]
MHEPLTAIPSRFFLPHDGTSATSTGSTLLDHQGGKLHQVLGGGANAHHRTFGIFNSSRIMSVFSLAVFPLSFAAGFRATSSLLMERYTGYDDRPSIIRASYPDLLKSGSKSPPDLYFPQT